MSQYVGPALVRSLYQSEAALAGIYGALHGDTLDVAAWSGDLYYGGRGAIADTLAVEDPTGTPERPISRRVSLLDRRSLLIVRSTWADPITGAYAFPALSTAIPFMIIADDALGTYNAVVADWIYAS